MLRFPVAAGAATRVAIALVAIVTVARLARAAADEPAGDHAESGPEASSAAAGDADDKGGGEGAAASADDDAVDAGVTSSSFVTRASTELSLYQDSDHITVITPTVAGSLEKPSQGWAVKGRYLADVISAASVDIVSTASRRWHEVRHAGSVEAAYKPHDFGVGASGSISSEPDYLSYAGGANVTLDFDQDNRNLLLGFAHGRDTIGRSGTPFDVFSHILNRNTLNAAFTSVVDRSTIFALIGDAMYERGDQSKPYRYIPMFAAGTYATLPAGSSIDVVNARRLQERPLEHLPLARDRYALTARVAHRFAASTVRLAERVYIDSWGLKASTTDLAYVTDLSERWSLGPLLRFHAQTPVVFWKRAYEVYFQPGGAWTFPALRTGDRELSALTTLTGGLDLRWDLGAAPRPKSWSLAFEVEGMWTHFYDALFIKNRIATFVAMTLEAQL